MAGGLKHFAVLLPLLLAVAGAQDKENDIPTARQPSVSMRPISVVSITPGKPSKVELPFRISPGFHINSNRPRSALLIPTSLKLNPPTDIGIGKLRFPPGEELSFPFAPQEKLRVYSGEFVVTARLAAARTAMPGPYKVHGILKYQACDDRACYPPRQQPVEFDVRVQRAPATPATSCRGRNPAQSPHIHR